MIAHGGAGWRIPNRSRPSPLWQQLCRWSARARSPGALFSGQTESWSNTPRNVTFDRVELRRILDAYGRGVAAGEWKDYALDFGPQKSVFSIFRRASEAPLYRIEKVPALSRKQGAFAIVTVTRLGAAAGQ